MLQPEDKEDLELAAILVNRVLERHRSDPGVTLGTISILCQSLQDLRIGEKLLERS